MNPVQILTPVISESNCFLNNLQTYFYFGGDIALIRSIDKEAKTTEIEFSQGSTSWISSAIKIISYFTLILPLLVFISKCIVYYTNQYTVQVSSEIGETPTQNLVVRGKIPAWLSGSFLRNGPTAVTVGGKTNEHWFDGLAMLHAFFIGSQRVSYANSFLRTDAYKAVFEKGTLNYPGFAADPCRTLFNRVTTAAISCCTKKPPKMPNANVNIAKLAGQFVALTETPLPILFDPKTLKTQGAFEFADKLPQKDCWESAHPRNDLKTEQTTNILIEFGRNSYYVIYTIDKGSSTRKVLAKIRVENPAYMHSFGLSDDYIILTEFPLVCRPIDFVIYNKPFIHNFQWKPKKGTKFILVDRKSGKVVEERTTKSFFAFHHINSFEDDKNIYIDAVTYQDATIITGSTLHQNSADYIPPPSTKPRIERFTLPKNSSDIQSEILFDTKSELPRINPKYEGKTYEFIYSANFNTGGRVDSKEFLCKNNLKTRETVKWEEDKCSPGEPIFIPNPDAKTEDDGVIISVVIDRKDNSSFLLFLDGQTFTEIARAKAPHKIPQGLHGQFYP